MLKKLPELIGELFYLFETPYIIWREIAGHFYARYHANLLLIKPFDTVQPLFPSFIVWPPGSHVAGNISRQWRRACSWGGFKNVSTVRFLILGRQLRNQYRPLPFFSSRISFSSRATSASVDACVNPFTLTLPVS